MNIFTHIQSLKDRIKVVSGSKYNYCITTAFKLEEVDMNK
ncbi:unnamed protein product [Acanthoscelides obtectus]|uniref:Uncharacterized protein n=1 Tax=Acanthoscelides obtectus TaxID=200917 RepID=A0A9P0PVC5_ACAOB|nr:unnamed protein product [Acanthoscelides obtectus]CAK1662771.1 hypothetical protein AOBTE_LOCUS23303 [Acanthoscelides obtectus]